jgi:predicted transposase/invertase (TIGR01784 family)
MGIVIIDRLPDSPETMWLKMLGNRESAQSAFQSIEQLSPDRREKNDIIRACVKYCVYLRDIPTDSLTPEEQDFMKTMAQVDAWYETEMNKAQLEGEFRGKLEGKKEIAINLLRKNIALEVVAEVTGFTISKLEGFANEQLQQLRLSEREATSTNE